MKKCVLKYLFFFLVIVLPGCSGCSKSGHRDPRSTIDRRNNKEVTSNENTSLQRTVVKMQKNNSVYEIPTEINGIQMHFIFDTGAGMISISATEANFLYKQGSLTDDDVVGTANFIDANGEISEGTIITLKTVKIGDKTLRNVEASVVHNLNAPLLMGQSALEKFGKISIDYDRGEISFE
jgi:aspartyl protease family protein